MGGVLAPLDPLRIELVPFEFAGGPFEIRYLTK